MPAYKVSYKLRRDISPLSPREAEDVDPFDTRIVTSDAQRAISALVNDLKAEGVIGSKGDVKILEVKIVP